MATSSTSNNNKKPIANPLELLRDAGDAAEIAMQLFGRMPRREQKFSGEIVPGQSLEMKKVYSGQASNEEKLRRMIALERRMRQEDQMLVERRTQELRIQIKAIHEEVQKAAKATIELSEEVQIAAFQAPSSDSVYELYFLERMFDFIKSFRKKIQNASVWMAAANKRSRKKNMWGSNYKKHGAKYLLSSEHYLQRSAG